MDDITDSDFDRVMGETDQEGQGLEAACDELESVVNSILVARKPNKEKE